MAFSDNSSISATAARWRRRCRLPASPANGSRRIEGDSQKLALQHRFGDLAAVRVFDPVHEAIRDLVRARRQTTLTGSWAVAGCVSALSRNQDPFSPAN
jgi:transposase